MKLCALLCIFNLDFYFHELYEPCNIGEQCISYQPRKQCISYQLGIQCISNRVQADLHLRYQSIRACLKLYRLLQISYQLFTTAFLSLPLETHYIVRLRNNIALRDTILLYCQTQIGGLGKRTSQLTAWFVEL